MRLKIVSDGTPQGTHLIDEATGEPVRSVRKITWSMEAKRRATAVIEVVNLPIEAVGVEAERKELTPRELQARAVSARLEAERNAGPPPTAEERREVIRGAFKP